VFNFKFRSDKADGQFNGRFAFRAPFNAPRLTPIELRALANATEDALVDPVIRHEYLHWKVFKGSAVGRSLIGKRYRVRAQFLRGNQVAVENYYLQRSCYFLNVYEIHEQIVTELESLLGSTPTLTRVLSTNLSERQRRLVERADADALTACRNLERPYKNIELKADSFLGAIATREFGLQAYIDLGHERLSLNEVSLMGSTHGIFNAATETQYSDASAYIRLIRKAVQYANAELWFGRLTQEKLATWAYLKLKVEINLLWEHPHSVVVLENQGSVRELVASNVNFIAAYTGVKYDKLTLSLITELFLACARTEIAPQDLIQRLGALDNEFLYFFYAHGN
jgi:hypothetical protein